mgnify:CR=1 FL=1
MKLTKSPLYPIGSLMFYLFIPVVYGKMNKAMVARLTGHFYSNKRNILPINPKYDNTYIRRYVYSKIYSRL